MSIFFHSQNTKEEVFAGIEQELARENLVVINKEAREWGGFFVIEESQAEQFLDTYFATLNKSEILAQNKLSPKILVVQPGKRLSWQYHHRRAELWKVIGPKVGIVKSETDAENSVEVFDNEDIIKLKVGQRHRLVGMQEWGIIAEIWQHTDKDAPSNENDIVRLSDDFGR